MRVWWSALDTEHTSYEEVKHRLVVAQGWQALGNLEFLGGFLPDHRGPFVKIIQLLGDVHYGSVDWWRKDRQPTRTPTVFWNLFSVSSGDLVIGLEGVTVKGICQLSNSGRETYRYQPDWEYAQTIGFPVKWHDWDDSILGSPPVSPSKGILGIRHLGKASQTVLKAWEKVGW